MTVRFPQSSRGGTDGNCAVHSKPVNTECEALINAEQAAELLRIHPKTVKRLAAEGRIPGMRIGKLWRFRESSLDEWMDSQIQFSRHPCPNPKGEQ